MSTETSYDTLFGRMAVDQGLCTDEELRKAIQECKERRKTDPLMLQDLMVQLGYLTASQAERLKTSVKESKVAATQIPGYKILGKLGAGAMAVVYKGKQLSLNRSVAIKVLPRRFSENPEYVQRFYKEGQAAGKLNHPNIVQAIDVGEAGGYHYFVMEYVEGKTIADDISNGHIFGEQEAIEIIIQVCHALQHAHAHGLVHRDVKPKNIMINTQGVVKLADMGLARETTDIEAAQSEEGKAYGTPYYIAPEQIRGKIDIDGRADIYGLGATFYHMVTGRVPFTGEDSAEIMKRHLREKLVPPDHINTALSAGVSEVIEIMLAKRREDRYNNVEELLLDLEALRQGHPPLQAHKRFDVEMLEKLEDGETVEIEHLTDTDEIITRYRLYLLILGAVSAIAILIIVGMLVL
ncbi:MAG TPA: serine/threonine-protein kinase [Sedimentisphaerales bacterium]|jgi:serine/threonine protein kinase|nr:serine/threonine-protein kinase [Sedimentisphaerales bacterium]HNU30945.1 serine/threonine-protein kinase [Sedimentisphaerales bacterium]